MASWTGTEYVRWPTIHHEQYPNWFGVDCGCCGGIEWSSGYPANECSDCRGNGRRWVHIPTGTVALYPGGPLLGAKMSSDQIENIMSDYCNENGHTWLAYHRYIGVDMRYINAIEIIDDTGMTVTLDELEEQTTDNPTVPYQMIAHESEDPYKDLVVEDLDSGIECKFCPAKITGNIEFE